MDQGIMGITRDDDVVRTIMGESLDARGSIDDITDHRRIHTPLGSYRAHDDTPCIYPDPDIDISTDRRDLELADELLDLDRRMDRIVCMVIVEYSEHPITEILVDISMMRVYDLPDPVEIDIEEEECTIRICDRLTHGRELHDVEEHDRETLAFGSTENDPLISAESDLRVDLLRDECIEHFFEIIIVFFEEFVLDICPMKQREELGILRELFVRRHHIGIFFLTDKSREMLEQASMLTPIP